MGIKRGAIGDTTKNIQELSTTVPLAACRWGQGEEKHTTGAQEIR